jgi:hypothetical protein
MKPKKRPTRRKALGHLLAISHDPHFIAEPRRLARKPFDYDGRRKALLQGFALGAGPVGFARRRRRAGRQWVGASNSRDGSLPMR